MSKLNYYMLNSEEFKNDAFRVNTLNKPTDTKVANAFERFWDSGLNASNLIDGLTKSTLDTAISDQEHPIMQLKTSWWINDFIRNSSFNLHDNYNGSK